MITELKELLTEYEITIITKQNYTQFMEIYESNDDYFILSGGEKASADNFLENLEAVPSNFSIEKKVVIGFGRNNRSIAVLDLLAGYPDSNCCWIGLLLVHQEMQGKRIGSEIVNAAAKAAKSKGYSSLQLGVIDTNEKALIFWEKLGFKKMRVTKVKHDNMTDWNVVVMEKKLCD